jgi:hypothetical protein
MNRSIGWIPLVFFAYASLLNALYFFSHGWLAVHASDLWFFLALAKGTQHLSSFDITSWLVLPFSKCEVEQGLLGLMILSMLLIFLSSLLVYFYLGKINGIEKWNRVFLSILFLFLPQNTMLATAGFAHFSVAQPLLIIAFGELLPWALSIRKIPSLIGIIALIESMVIGPEGYFVALALVLIFLSKQFDFVSFLKKIHVHPMTVIFIFCIGLGLSFSSFFDLWNNMSMKFRGIDLSWQKAQASSDLSSMGFQVFTIFGCFHVIWIMVGFYGFKNKKYLLIFFLITFFVLTSLLVRFYLALELVGFICLVFLIAEKTLPSFLDKKLILICCAWLFLFGTLGKKECFFPPSLLKLAKSIGPEEKSIACSSSYGFFFEACGFKATDDMHKPPGLWRDLAAMNPQGASQKMRENQIDVLFLTTYDFRLVRDGFLTTGGLGEKLQKLSDDALTKTVVFQVLANPSPFTEPLKIFSDLTDSPSGLRTVCLR